MSQIFPSEICSAKIISVVQLMVALLCRDLVFCLLCLKLGKVRSPGKGDTAFVIRAIAIGKMQQAARENFAPMKLAIEYLVTIPATHKSVALLLSSRHAQEKLKNNKRHFINTYVNEFVSAN